MKENNWLVQSWINVYGIHLGAACSPALKGNEVFIFIKTN